MACTDREVFPDLSLTTVEIDPGRTGREAMQLLLDIVEGRGDAHSNIEIPLRLIAASPVDSARMGALRAR